MNKKGQDLNLGGLATIVILLVVAGIVVVFGLDVTGDVPDYDKMCSNSGTYNATGARNCYNSTGGSAGTGYTYIANSSFSTEDGVSNISAKFPLLGTIIIVSVILAALGAFLAFRIGR